MSNELRFVVLGRPQGKGSKRVMPVGGRTGRRMAVVDTNRKARPWADRVAFQARENYHGALVRQAVQVHLHFYFARPKGHFGTGRNASEVKGSAPRYMAVMPDVDKLARCTLDALTGVVLADDALIASLRADKLYGEPERVEIRVQKLA